MVRDLDQRYIHLHMQQSALVDHCTLEQERLNPPGADTGFRKGGGLGNC